MKSSPAGLSLIALGFLLGSSSVVAHHGDAGRYDETPVTLSGTVVSLQLMNPHSLLGPRRLEPSTWRMSMVGS